MHPNGQMPAYEFAFGDVNPPVHAWACWRVYKMTGAEGPARPALPRARVPEAAAQLHLVGQPQGPGGQATSSPAASSGWTTSASSTARSPLPDRRPPRAGRRHRLDGVLLRHHARDGAGAGQRGPGVRGHRVQVLRALRRHRRRDQHARRHRACGTRRTASTTTSSTSDGRHMPLRVRSLVGLMPLLAVEVLDEAKFERLPGLPEADELVPRRTGRTWPGTSPAWSRGWARTPARSGCWRFPTRERLERVLRYLLDEKRVPLAVRHPLAVAGPPGPALRARRERRRVHRVDYVPGESNTGLFGGNSNWRGPIWFPINYLLIEALERYHHFYGDELQVECPTGSGRHAEPAAGGARSSSARLARIFLPDARGRRPCHGGDQRYADDPALAGPRALPRVLPRRHRPRPGREPPDRLDRARAPVHRGRGRAPRRGRRGADGQGRAARLAGSRR